MNTLLRLADLVEEVGGIVTPERDLDRLRRVANARMAETGYSELSTYVELLESAPEGQEWRAILRRYTVKESYLFRAHRQFEVLAETVVPKLAASGRSALKLWSAGCAHGEETASLAVTMASIGSEVGEGWTILGTDIDDEALDVARRGLFSARAMRKVPSDLVDRYFTRCGDRFSLTEKPGDTIEYRYLNLVRKPLALANGPFDIIFLRNVLIYFNRESQRRVIASVASHLAPDGYLFVGPSESLWQVSTELEAHDLAGCFAYTHRAVSQSSESEVAERHGDYRQHAVEGEDKRLSRKGWTEDSGDNPAPSGDPTVHTQLGLAAEWNALFVEAVRHYRAASYLDPTLVQVRFLLARCFGRCGWYRRARAEYHAALDLIDTNRAQLIPGSDDLGLPTLPEIEFKSRAALEKGPAPRRS